MVARSSHEKLNVMSKCFKFRVIQFVVFIGHFLHRRLVRDASDAFSINEVELKEIYRTVQSLAIVLLVELVTKYEGNNNFEVCIVFQKADHFYPMVCL